MKTVASPRDSPGTQSRRPTVEGAHLLTTSVLTELDQIFGELEASDDIRVAVLTATGRFFCPGADMKELALLATAYQGAELSGRGQALPIHKSLEIR